MKKNRYISFHMCSIRTMSMTLCAAIVMLFSSCGSKSDIENELRDTEMAIASGDMNVAKSVASHISEIQESTPNLTASQLARLSIVYMQLADYSDEDTNTAMAVNYCRAAMKENADSAEAYYNQLPPDQVAYGRAVQMLVQHLDNPSEVDVTDVSDSLMSSPDTIMADK